MRPALPALLLVLASAVTRAHAENERALSVGLGWATFSAPGEASGNMEPPAITPDVGGAVAITYEHALGSDVAVRGELAGGIFYGGNAEGQQALSYAALADVGAVYRFDVLKYVPYAFAGVGAVGTTGGPIPRDVNFVLTIGGGLDILVSRASSYGFEARLASFGGDITLFTLGVRATTRWGYF
ncbi:MAG: hypothetical protein SFX73_36735 [Kofleriaceae bacterium]|nr:hypothetical protein [Kofleriaceae bacterium]